MKMNDDAIRRALRQAPPPPLPEGFTLRLMERVRRKARRRERIETALLLAGGIALFGALIAASLRRLAPEWHPEWPGPGSLPRIELPVISLPELPAEGRPQLLGMVLIAALFLALHLLGLLSLVLFLPHSVDRRIGYCEYTDQR